MSSTLLVSTRKGLFTCERDAGGWRVARASFLGDRVSLALADPRDGTWYAALDHGHFGVKLQRSTDRGATWTEVATPAYPPKPDGVEDVNPFGKPTEWTTKLFREFILTQILRRAVPKLGLDPAEANLRVTLAASHLVGLAMARYVIKVEPLASVPSETLVAAIGPTVQRYLTEDLPGVFPEA